MKDFIIQNYYYILLIFHFILAPISSFSLSSLAHAQQQTDPLTPQIIDYETQISFNFYSGEYLIYDCVEKHFACVNYSGYEKCSAARKNQEMLGQSFLVCAPFKKFPHIQDCYQEQNELVSEIEISTERNSLPFCYILE